MAAVERDPGPSYFDGLDVVPFSPRSLEGAEYKGGALPALSVPDSMVGCVTHSGLIIPKDLPTEGQTSHSQPLQGHGRTRLSQEGQGLEYPASPLLEMLGNLVGWGIIVFQTV